MKQKKTIVEVAMEISLTPELLDAIAMKFSPIAARESAMTTSVGGIGPLLRERMIMEAELGHDIIGVTLLYDNVWVQRWQQWGQLYLEKRPSGWHIREVLEKQPHTITVTMYDGTSVEVNVWKAAYGKAVVYFLDYPEIASVVYPGVEDAPVQEKDKSVWYEEARIKQSWLLGRGTLELLKQMDIAPDVIILSETPTIFAWHKIVMDSLAKEPRFDRTQYVFNDHTPLEYAHPVWDTDRLERLKIDPVFYKDLDNPNNNDHKKVDITQMLVAGVERVYGVARLHGEVMRAMPTLRAYKKKIQTITNGVSVPFWQHPGFSRTDSLSDKDLIALKNDEKKKLINWVWKRCKFSSQWRDRAVSKPLLLLMRRITGYKRLDIITEMVKDEQLRKRFIAADVTILLGGRIHQQDGMSKWAVFNLLDFLNEHSETEERITFIDNYNVWEAPRLFHGIDGTIMMSDQGKEASATGFMKAQVNGGMVIATPDGAIPESVVFQDEAVKGKEQNGFKIEYQNNSPTPESFLKAVESFVSLYQHEEKRAALMRSAIKMTERVSVEKTAREMIDLFQEMERLQTGIKP